MANGDVSPMEEPPEPPRPMTADRPMTAEEVRAALAASAVPAHFHPTEEGTELALVLPGDPPRERVWLHLLLFLATLLTTLASGALLSGIQVRDQFLDRCFLGGRLEGQRSPQTEPQHGQEPSAH